MLGYSSIAEDLEKMNYIDLVGASNGRKGQYHLHKTSRPHL